MKFFVLTIAGGAVFWATTLVTSVLPIAAEYRAALSNWSMQTVWVDSLFAGIILAGCISYSFLRFFERIPTTNPISKSVILSCIALVISILLIDVPQSFLQAGSSETLYYFLIGVLFNTVRFVLFGIVIGYLYKKLYRSSDFALENKGY
jgi:hypothetical protein